MLAEAIACVIYVPVDVIKERLQVQKGIQSIGGGLQKGYYYKGSLDALKKITRNEGLGGIYKGYLATLGECSELKCVEYSVISMYYRPMAISPKYYKGFMKLTDFQNHSIHQMRSVLWTIFCIILCLL